MRHRKGSGGGERRFLHLLLYQPHAGRISVGELDTCGLKRVLILSPA